MSDEAKVSLHVVIFVVLVFIGLALWTAGEHRILGGLLKDGYSVAFDEEVSPGDGYYIVRIWRDGGWVTVER